MKSSVYVYVFIVIAVLYMCSCKKEIIFEKEIGPTAQEKNNWIKKHNNLSAIIIEDTCLKDVTIKEAILWLSDESKCTISLVLECNNQDITEADPFIDNQKQKSNVYYIKIKNCNFLEALDAICIKAGYCWKLTDDLIVVASESYFR